MMEDQRLAVHRTIVVVDVEGFGDQSRTNPDQVAVRDGLYRAMQEAFGRAGIPWDTCGHEDRGDGALVIFPPDLAAQPIIDVFPEQLRCLIRRHNRFSCEQGRMQLRVAVNVGPVYRDEHGFAGEDVTYLCRMLDAQPLRRALSESGTELAFIVSDYVYDKLILRRHSLAGTRSFRRVKTQVKRTPVHAWIYLPDRPVAVAGSGPSATGRPNH